MRWSGLNKDKAFLMHILDEIEYLTTASQSLELDEVTNDPHLHRSFIRSLEVIGEATKNLSKDLKDNHPEIEWRKIAVMRDKLIHYYFGVDWEVVWDVVKNKLPSLRTQIEGLIREID
jgi:uncharacterized protein with HEPN domain